MPIAPFATFASNKSIASWLSTAAHAANWQTFQRDGAIKKAH